MFQILWSTLIAHSKFLLALVIVVVCSLAGVGAKSWLSTSASKDTISSRSPQNHRNVEAEIITLNPSGFEPSELSRPQGPVVLSIFNRSGLEEINVRLEVEKGSHLKEVRAPRRKLDINELVELRPGRYRLTEVNHPEWSCVITVTPQ